MTFEEIKQHHLTDAQLEALLTAAHKAGRAVGHGRTKIITDYPNLSKHYAKYAMQTIKENHTDESWLVISRIHKDVEYGNQKYQL